MKNVCSPGNWVRLACDPPVGFVFELRPRETTRSRGSATLQSVVNPDLGVGVNLGIGVNLGQRRRAGRFMPRAFSTRRPPHYLNANPIACLRAGEGEVEGAAFFDLAFGPDAAAMGQDDVFDDGKTEA